MACKYCEHQSSRQYSYDCLPFSAGDLYPEKMQGDVCCASHASKKDILEAGKVKLNLHFVQWMMNL